MLIGLAPMDGITDPAFRQIVDIYGRPDILYTEFIPAEGLAFGAKRLFPSLLHHNSKTKTIAQFFGVNPESFYTASIIALALGYDGVDINMGCPDRNIGKRGGGGALIGKPELAVKIIQSVRQAVEDWKENSEEVIKKIPDNYKELVSDFRIKNKIKNKLNPTVSVKTRIGLDKPITEKWISILCNQDIDMLSVHGRTMIQMYKGMADWNEIQKASQIAHNSQISLIGNGDIQSIPQAHEYAQKYDVDGVLIGRAAFGNPWIFADTTPTLKERFAVMIEHCKLYLEDKPEHKLFPMRKHLAWYCKGFEGSRKMRDQLMKIETMSDVNSIISQHTKTP